jgi:hypothetical protein
MEFPEFTTDWCAANYSRTVTYNTVDCGPIRSNVIDAIVDRIRGGGLAQTGQEATFHVDHVVPVVAGGQSTSENLAGLRLIFAEKGRALGYGRPT